MIAGPECRACRKLITEDEDFFNRGLCRSCRDACRGQTYKCAGCGDIRGAPPHVTHEQTDLKGGVDVLPFCSDACVEIRKQKVQEFMDKVTRGFARAAQCPVCGGPIEGEGSLPCCSQKCATELFDDDCGTERVERVEEKTEARYECPAVGHVLRQHPAMTTVGELRQKLDRFSAHDLVHVDSDGYPDPLTEVLETQLWSWTNKAGRVVLRQYNPGSKVDNRRKHRVVILRGECL